MSAFPGPAEHSAVPTRRRRSAAAVAALAVTGTGLGLAGTDLVLPSVPELSTELGGTAGLAQMVLSAYAVGTALGLLLWGSVAARIGQGRVLAGGLALFAVTSAVAAASPDLGSLVVIRFVQGVAGAAPAVVAPGILRASLRADRVRQGLAVLGSVESVVPAAAPVVGVAVMALVGWRGPFMSLAVAGFAAVGVLLLLRRSLTAPIGAPDGGPQSYRRVLRRGPFLRLGSAQALTLAGLLTFVLGAPAVIVGSMGGAVGDFVLMQVVNVLAFIVVANVSPRLAARFGAARTVALGTVLALLGAVAAAAYGSTEDPAAAALVVLFMPINVGLGLRGPTGFHLALEAGRDFERGAALILFSTMALAAAGNAAVAAMLDRGLSALAVTTAAILAGACALTAWSWIAGDFGRAPTAEQ